MAILLRVWQLADDDSPMTLIRAVIASFVTALPNLASLGHDARGRDWYNMQESASVLARVSCMTCVVCVVQHAATA